MATAANRRSGERGRDERDGRTAVTVASVARPPGDRDRDRQGGGDRREGGGDRRERRPSRDRQEARHERPARPAPPPVETKPKPKRLRPGKTHRNAFLEAVPAEQRPIAEQVLLGGIPAVRAAIDKQNDELKAAGKPAVKADSLLKVAEDLRPGACAACGATGPSPLSRWSTSSTCGTCARWSTPPATPVATTRPRPWPPSCARL